MKTRLLLLLAGFLALLTTVATAQCPAGTITLTNQADVDAFPSTYPGCTTVQGNLTIQHTDITNLDSLHYITYVTGGVRIFSNSALTTLSGLKNLTDVDGYFYITANPSLKTLSGLDNLATVGGLMAIQNNIALTTLSNLQSLKMISGGLSIENNSSLTTLQGLEKNTTIGGRLVILANSKLTTLSGLDNISSVSGRLNINSNPKLTTLSSLENISSVGGDLYINDNDALTTLSGLENISSLDGELYINSNDALTTLSGLDNISALGGDLNIIGNDALTTLSGLDNISALGGELYIYSNDALTTLSGLENIDPTTITELTIWDNSSLSFCDLPNICTYLTGGGYKNISGNADGCKTEMEVKTQCLPEIVFITDPPGIMGECGSPIQESDLPATVHVSFDDNTSGTIPVTWDLTSYSDTEGSYILIGTPQLAGETTNPGNLTAELLVIVKDTEVPIPDLTQLPTIEGICSVTVSDIPTATDACAGPIAATTDDPLEYDEQGTYIITWTYDDGNGHTLTQDQIVKVGATLKPVLQCGSTGIVSCEPVVTFDLPVATGPCGPVRVVQTDHTGLTSGSAFPVGKTTLTYRATNAAGSAFCSIVIEVLPELKVRHVSGIQNGDTLHLAACLPPSISKDDLDLGPHEKLSSVISRRISQDLPADPSPGLWKILRYEYDVHSICGESETFTHFVDLYDLSPPLFQNFPVDETITRVEDLPPGPDDVKVLDICRYVVWDSVTTTPVIDPGTGNTLAFVRRWMAEDEVGNKSYRDQMIYVTQATKADFGGLTAQVVKESDLVDANFPQLAGTNGIPVTLYRIDSTEKTTTAEATRLSGNWQGQYGSVAFTPVVSGLYQIKVEVPDGFTTFHADSLFTGDGWSDTLTIAGDTELALGSILLIPEVDTLAVDTILPLSQTTEIFTPLNSWSGHDFSVYPNPTTGRFKIGWKIGGTADYDIFNHLGQLVQSGTVDNGQEIDLSSSGTGVYFIQFRNEHQILGSKRILLMGR